MNQGDVIELELDAISHLGQALGRHKGKVVFVPYAIPGERARVRVVEDRKRWARGELLDLLRPSSHRVKPPCPYFGTATAASIASPSGQSSAKGSARVRSLRGRFCAIWSIVRSCQEHYPSTA